jgi:hypothetical protein
MCTATGSWAGRSVRRVMGFVGCPAGPVEVVAAIGKLDAVYFH